MLPPGQIFGLRLGITMIKSTLALATALFTVCGAAQASTVSTVVSIAGSGQPGSVGYLHFLVEQAGTFDIYTDGPTIDPELYLFRDGFDVEYGVISSGDAFIDSDDDSCIPGSPAFCEVAGSFDNSLLEGIFLSVGSYIIAVGDYELTESEARSGLNDSTEFSALTGDVGIFVTSARYTDGGVASDPNATSAIPLPAGLPLLVGGLGALGIAARRRRG